MSGNTFGRVFTVTTFGESHGVGVGCVIDGCPAGLALSVADIERELERRRPSDAVASTSRCEPDRAELLSGVFEGKTLGSPIAILVRNRDQHSGDYDGLRSVYRPGHADWTWEAKYGLRDHRGGGRASGRETVGRVAAGAVAKCFLGQFGITVRAWTAAIGGLTVPEDQDFDLDFADLNALRVPHREYAELIAAKLAEVRKAGDSAGGIVGCRISGLPAGLGEPVFDKLSAVLAHAVLSIGGTKGMEFGAGFSSASSQGSLLNDCPSELVGWLANGVPLLSFSTNNAGGMLGGLSTGQPVEFRVAFKPVPSIAQAQQTLDNKGQPQTLSIEGRHDVCIVPRAVAVVEAMSALALADLFSLKENLGGVNGKTKIRSNLF